MQLGALVAGSTNFPTSTDTFAKATPTYQDDEDTTGRVHSERHDDMEAAMEAVQTHFGDLQVDDLTDVDLTTAPVAGQSLTFDGVAWVPSGELPSSPEVIDIRAVSNNGAATMVSPSYVSAQAGDLLVAVAYGWVSATARSVNLPTAPDLTFNALWEVSPAADGYVKRIDWAWIPDSTARAVTWTASGAYTWAGHIMVIRGADPTTPLQGSVEETAQAAAVGTAHTYTGPVVADAGSLALAFVTSRDDNSLAVSGTDWTQEASANYFNVMAHLAASRVIPITGSTPDLTVNQTANGPDDSVGVICAVRPALLTAVALDDLSDVDTSTTAPTEGDVLTHDGTGWAPAAPTGGGSSLSPFLLMGA